MPHGDFSDFGALGCAVIGLTTIFNPEIWFASVGPIQPMFSTPVTKEAIAAIRFGGGLFMFMFPVLYVVRWNTINGKAGALGCWIAAANTAHIALSLDDFIFVLRGWYIISVFLVLVGAHLAFNANPMLTSKMLAEKEDARAAKAK